MQNTEKYLKLCYNYNIISIIDGGIIMSFKKDVRDVTAWIYFMSNLTKESREHYNEIFSNYQESYLDIHDHGWYADNKRNLHKLNSSAYLERTEDGYVIPVIQQTDADYQSEIDFINTCEKSIDGFFKSTIELNEFYNGNFDIKPGVKEEKVLKAAEVYGIKRNINGFKGPIFNDKCLSDNENYLLVKDYKSGEKARYNLMPDPDKEFIDMYKMLEDEDLRNILFGDEPEQDNLKSVFSDNENDGYCLEGLEEARQDEKHQKI